MTIEKAIDMIDEYLLEPNNIDKDWVEALTLCREALISKNSDTTKHSKWEISFDGYYPYCLNCGYEPDRDNLTDCCPKCNSIMDGDIDA